MKQMTLRKITIDSCVKFITKSEQTQNSKPSMIKIESVPREQNENISQDSKSSLILWAAEGFRAIK